MPAKAKSASPPRPNIMEAFSASPPRPNIMEAFSCALADSLLTQNKLKNLVNSGSGRHGDLQVILILISAEENS